MTARYKRTVLGTCCLPWRDDDTLDEARFRRSIRNLVGAGLPDLYVFGTAGEGHAVSDVDYRRVVTIFVEEMRASGGTPMVGVIALSLRTILERIAFAADQGVEVIQFSIPAWGPLNDRELRQYFAAVCDGFPELQFLHYNLMRTGRLVRPSEYVELVEAHPNLVATKYGAGDPETVGGLLRLVPQLRHFLTEPGYYTGAPLGEPGLLASIAASNPTRAWAYFRSGADGDQAALAGYYRELAGMMGEIRRAAGGMGLTDGAYDKIISKVADPDFPLRLLPPYQSATNAGYHSYVQALEREFADWLPTPIEEH
jgi:dihydrodipicolinate synthase/N-acetylneuraminate lyase